VVHEGGMFLQPIKWQEGELVLLDQSLLPSRVEYCHCRNYLEVAEAIKTMKVRGAPAIGVSAAYGVVLAALSYQGEEKREFFRLLEEACIDLRKTRPTAINLFWALDRMKKVGEEKSICSLAEIKKSLEKEAQQILEEDLQANKQMGAYGNQLIPQEATILTHCNAGALATAGFGTALGVIRTAYQAGKKVQVYADETRPLLQGARLTAWELLQEGIPVTLIADNMAGYLFKQGKIDLVIVGADRVAANGDVANKIGTYSVAVLAHYHQVPFYVAAPFSTFDVSLVTGQQIPIEERDEEEMRKWGQYQLAPQNVPVYNPAFDVTPAKLVTAFITEKGIIRPPFHFDNKL
jgi:methylthioribose-1-phosphate isomerase